jgi:hypothetical protein
MIAATKQRPARTSFLFLNSDLAFVYENAYPTRATQYVKNPIRMGAAARWHGYAARDGLGMTRNRYQAQAANPANIRDHFGHALLLMPVIFPVFGQRLNKFEKNMLFPPGRELILPLILAASLEGLLRISDYRITVYEFSAFCRWCQVVSTRSKPLQFLPCL